MDGEGVSEVVRVGVALGRVQGDFCWDAPSLMARAASARRLCSRAAARRAARSGRRGCAWLGRSPSFRLDMVAGYVGGFGEASMSVVLMGK